MDILFQSSCTLLHIFDFAASGRLGDPRAAGRVIIKAPEGCKVKISAIKLLLLPERGL